MLYALEKETNTSSINIKLDDKETLELFQHVNDISYPISIDGIPEFGTTFVKRMIEIAKPQNINDLFYYVKLCIYFKKKLILILINK